MTNIASGAYSVEVPASRRESSSIPTAAIAVPAIGNTL